jgi:hypothetical protein
MCSPRESGRRELQTALRGAAALAIRRQAQGPGPSHPYNHARHWPWAHRLGGGQRLLGQSGSAGDRGRAAGADLTEMCSPGGEPHGRRKAPPGSSDGARKVSNVSLQTVNEVARRRTVSAWLEKEPRRWMCGAKEIRPAWGAAQAGDELTPSPAESLKRGFDRLTAFSNRRSLRRK